MNFVVISITSYEKAQLAIIIFQIYYLYNSSFELLIIIIVQWILLSKHTLYEIYLKMIIFLKIKPMLSALILYGFFGPKKMWRMSWWCPLYVFTSQK